MYLNAARTASAASGNSKGREDVVGLSLLIPGQQGAVQMGADFPMPNNEAFAVSAIASETFQDKRSAQ